MALIPGFTHADAERRAPAAGRAGHPAGKNPPGFVLRDRILPPEYCSGGHFGWNAAWDAKRMKGRPDTEFAAELMRFIKGAEDVDFGARVLPAFMKKGLEMDAAALASYIITLDTPGVIGYGPGFDTGAYYEARYVFCLRHCHSEGEEGRMIATLGFDAVPGGPIVKRVQGVKGCRGELDGIKWERALLKSFVAWAATLGLETVFMTSARGLLENRGPWLPAGTELDYNHLRLIYDVTAERCGFRMGENGIFRHGPHLCPK